MEPPDPDHSRGAAIRSGVASLSAGGAATWLFFRVIGSVIIIPVAEELAFRGYLTRRLISSDFRSIPPGHLTWISFFASSLLFGACTVAGWRAHWRAWLTLWRIIAAVS